MLLSYGGTIGIICFLKIINEICTRKKTKNVLIKVTYKTKLIEYIKNVAFVSISAQIVILPIMAYSYKTMSLTFFITNILTSYIIGIIIIFGFILILISFPFLGIAKIVGIFYKLLIDLLLFITENTAKIPLSKIYIKVPSLWQIIVYYIFIFSIAYFYNKNGRKIFILKIFKLIHAARKNYKKVISIILSFILIFTLISICPKDLKIYFIDVGQGDSCLVITPRGKAILIDGGGSETYDVGENTLIPYLLSRKITTLDYVICSHFDTDHVRGILSVMEELKVRNAVISKQGKSSENYEKFKKIAKDKKINVVIVSKGDKLEVEKNFYFDILWPREELIQENILNNNSIVAKLNYNNFSMLFTGDIEEIAEKEIVSIYKGTNALKSTILKVGHHGSKTSSTQEFLNAIKPKIALIGVGENNTFGHPSDSVIERLENLGTKIYRTDQMGEISITVNNIGKIDIQQYVCH